MQRISFGCKFHKILVFFGGGGRENFSKYFLGWLDVVRDFMGAFKMMRTIEVDRYTAT